MKLMVLIAIPFVVTSCAEFTHLTTTRDLVRGSDSRAVIMDAKQRTVLSSRTDRVDYIFNPNDDRFEERKYQVDTVCAEPSPDAISALAASLGFNFQGEEFGEIATELSQAEGVSALTTRTQSIQLMRDAMYRLCESYMNSGMNRASYHNLHRRLQNTMLAILAIEQITGVQVQSAAALASEATIGSAELLAKYTDLAEEERVKVRELRAEQQAKQVAFNNAVSAMNAAQAAVTIKEEEIERARATNTNNGSSPVPKTPDPETPDPETPNSETPDPETPNPETPDPETPDPETPDPETPDPETPNPETPDPETPDPETPDPETPDPDASTTPLDLLEQELTALNAELQVKTAAQIEAKTELDDATENLQEREETLAAYENARDSANDVGSAQVNPVFSPQVPTPFQYAGYDSVGVAQVVEKIVAQNYELRFIEEACASIALSINANEYTQVESMADACLRFIEAETEKIAIENAAVRQSDELSYVDFDSVFQADSEPKTSAATNQDLIDVRESIETLRHSVDQLRRDQPEQLDPPSQPNDEAELPEIIHDLPAVGELDDDVSVSTLQEIADRFEANRQQLLERIQEIVN